MCFFGSYEYGKNTVSYRLARDLGTLGVPDPYLVGAYLVLISSTVVFRG